MSKMKKARNEEERLEALSRQRMRNEQSNTHERLADFARILHPKIKRALQLEDYSGIPMYAAFKLVCESSKIIPVSLKTLIDKDAEKIEVEQLARMSQINLREVLLAGEWWKEDNGPLLGYFEEDGRPAALIPKTRSSYTLIDPAKGEAYMVTQETASKLMPHGVFLYRPLPNKKLNLIDIMKFAMEGCWKQDAVAVGLIALAGALLGLIVPKVTQQMFDVYIPGREMSQLVQVGALLIGFLLGQALFHLCSSFAMLRLEGKMEAGMQSAVWDRLLALPVGFFRNYTSGELVMRTFGISQIRAMISGSMSSTILSSAFSLLYLFQVAHYGKKLAVYGIIMVAILMAVSYAAGKFQLKYEKEFLETTNKTSGLVLQLFGAIAKFRVSGAEPRAFHQWATLFAKSRKINYRKETISTVVTVITTLAPLIFSLVFYVVAVKKDMNMATGEFLAFTSAFGAFSSAMISIIQTILQINVIKPTYEMCKPILEALPEYDDVKDDPGVLTGNISMENIRFRYDKDGPLILDDVNLSIKEGEYVAIVGPSGGGKSTLFRLLLGFETPESGQVYYNNKDLATVNLKEVRRQLGVVIQNAQLMSGDVFSNIIGANTKLTVEDVNRAIEMAGMKEDIGHMPMGLHTVVSEGATTLSGGQRQRLLIARAIVNNPKILFFDEATSALDNKTQKIVQESLDGLQSTRVIIAHRLSTIINCDRIIVVEKGRIVEQGNYQQLLQKGGLFYEMARRQIV